MTTAELKTEVFENYLGWFDTHFQRVISNRCAWCGRGTRKIILGPLSGKFHCLNRRCFGNKIYVNSPSCRDVFLRLCIEPAWQDQKTGANGNNYN
jgi:hypothetical protein